MNIKEYKTPNILFLTGVFIKDCCPLEDLFEKQILDKLNVDVKICFNKIPSIFNSLNTWIKKTNIKCWHCDLNFETIPVFIPKVIEQSGTDSTFKIITNGCFCSFPCAISYNNIYHPKIFDNINNKEMISYLYKIFNKCNIKEILHAPSKFTMLQYGGSVDPDEYRKQINDINIKLKELEYKIRN